jgi:hypothetical protein
MRKIVRAAFLPACFLSTLAGVANSGVAGELHGVYGRVEQCPFGTLRFITDDGAQFALPGGAAQAGDYIRVSGTIDPFTATICGLTTYLPNLTVSELEPAFAGCGPLSLAGDMPSIVARDGQTLLLTDSGQHEDGEWVFVRGVLADIGEPSLLVQDNEIGVCASLLGRIDLAGECNAVRNLGGILISVAQLSNLSVGDFVLIEGRLNGSSFVADEPDVTAGGGCVPAILDNFAIPAFGGVGAPIAPDACYRNFQPDFTAGTDPIAVFNLQSPEEGERFILDTVRPQPHMCGATAVDSLVEMESVRQYGELLGPAPGGWYFYGNNGVLHILEGVGDPPISAETYVTGARAFTLASAGGGGGSITVRYPRVHRVLEGQFSVDAGFECTPLGRAPDNSLWTLLNFDAPAGRRYHIRGVADVACSDFCPYPCLYVTEIGAASIIPADMNCDGVVSVSDIAPFVVALTDPAAYAKNYPYCDMNSGDVNNDGNVSVGDIGIFVMILTGEA